MTKEKQTLSKNLLSKAVNVLFIGLVLLLLFSPGAKAWLLQQLIGAGLFKAEIKKETMVPGPGATPPLLFRDEEGNPVSTAALKGKVVFLNFWATWCPPCRAEMPSLHKLYKELKGDNRIVFLFINEDEDVAKAKAYLQKEQFTLPLVTRDGNLPATLYSGTLPTTVILDKEGRVVFRHEGLAAYNTATFIRQLKEFL